jgi:hypothetical protein
MQSADQLVGAFFIFRAGDGYWTPTRLAGLLAHGTHPRPGKALSAAGTDR